MLIPDMRNALPRSRSSLPTLAAAALAVALSTLAPAAAAAAGIRAQPGVAPGDCAGCHRGEAVRPAGHVDTRAQKLDDCVRCHAPRTAQALGGKIPTSHVHRLAGVGCADCHGARRAPEPVEAARCLGCHGPASALVAATAKVQPENPHDSPHWGPQMECLACHRQHSRTVNWCAHCHGFAFRVP